MLTLETERLILRTFTAEDAPALHREIYSDRDVLVHYNGGKVLTLEETQSVLPKRFGGNQFGYWAVTRKDDGQLLGQVHLDAYVNAGWHDVPEDTPSPFQSVEVHLGFAFGKRFWGNGYATEACRAVIRYAFTHLRLKRLVGGANANNLASIRLHQRLGFHTSSSLDGTGVNAILNSPLAAYTLRPFREEDLAGVSALGAHVIDWWHGNGPGTALHLVAETAATGEIVGHLQVVDRGFPLPSRRPGQCHFTLEVAPEHRRRSIGGALYVRAEAFARGRNARLLYAAFTETDNAPAAPFLAKRGFELLERFYPSCLDLNAFDPTRFASAIERVQAQGIRLVTYADIGDSTDNRRKLYELEQLAHATQPFREVEPYLPEPYANWEQEFAKRDPETIFLALANTMEEAEGAKDAGAVWAGVVTGLEWYFTGVHPEWRGLGLATALKVQCITEAKKRGLVQMETENHGDNAAMLAVNRKLGFIFTAPEAAYVKRFS